MTSHFESARVARMLACCAAVLLLASCSEGEKATTVRESAVVGTWETSSGGHIALRRDRTFDVGDVDWNVTLNEESCPDGDAKGSWGFWAEEGESGQTVALSSTATSGDAMGLRFENPTGARCTLTLNVVDNGDALCAAEDMDTVCGLDVRFSRTGRDG
ncbi:hypothetical protein [Streptomyces cyaneofuscatus]|uniref:hypothetical protein n=1 Tax=Streptomyces cyaneofuscatus TaxID=66883 RepID=UPI00364E2A7F